MATTFSSELDGTNGAALTANTTDGGNSGFDSKTGAWIYTTGTKASGTASATCSVTADVCNLQRNHAPAPVTVRYYDFIGRLSSFDGGNVMLAQIRLGGTNKAQLVVNADGTISLKNGTFSAATSATALSTAEFFRVQWGIDGSTQTLRLWKSATLANLFGTRTEEVPAAYSQGEWDQFRAGCMTLHTLDVWLDRVVMDSVTWPGVGGSGNAAPVANAGPDQSKTAGDTVTMAGSGTDSDGTIASYLWSQVSGPAITFSSTTAQNPTFTAPSVVSSSDVVVGLRVTDNLGTQSARDDVIITVAPASSTPTSDFYALFNNGPAGATATPANTGMTSVDAGITFTADAIGEGAYAATGTAAGATLLMAHSLTAGPIQYIDAVFKLSTIASGSGPFYIMRVRSGTTVRGSVRVEDGTLGTAGALRMRNGTTATGTATTKLITAGQPFRVAWHIDNTAGTQELRLFTGANLWGSTPDVGGTSSGTFNTGTFDGCSVGFTLAATGTWTIDSLRVDHTTWPAAITAPVPHSNFWIMQADGTLLESTFSVIA